MWNLSLCKRPIERIQTNHATLLPAAREKLLGSRCNIGYKRASAHLRKRKLIVHREDSLRYFTIRSRWSIKKKRTTGEVEKILQPRTKLCFAYRWSRQTKTVWFFTTGMHRWFFEETLFSNKTLEITGKFYLDAIRQLRSIPKNLKVYDGTGHAVIQSIHILLRESVEDSNSLNSFSVVPSNITSLSKRIG